MALFRLQLSVCIRIAEWLQSGPSRKNNGKDDTCGCCTNSKLGNRTQFMLIREGQILFLPSTPEGLFNLQRHPFTRNQFWYSEYSVLHSLGLPTCLLMGRADLSGTTENLPPGFDRCAAHLFLGSKTDKMNVHLSESVGRPLSIKNNSRLASRGVVLAYSDRMLRFSRVPFFSFPGE